MQSPPGSDGPVFAAGACWYPEQWPEDMWARDVARMRGLGLQVVRVGEFAWSRLEPARGDFRLGWLRRALELLADNGLRAVLGTPTACPPRWLLDDIPDLPVVAADGRALGFGSRRHGCHAHPQYRRECARVAAALADEFGRHPAVVAWQVDNEYGCHDTARSHSRAAAAAFRKWLRRRHGSVAALNENWGNAFWSQDYGTFSQIVPPGPTPAEHNPALLLDFRRFTSESIREFNRVQVDAIRPRSPGRAVLHNFMGFTPDFDHFALSRDLDAAAWDSYPLGFLARFGAEEEQMKFARVGHPDHAAFHHDLYRGCGRGRFWVMEQQPGPVNWAPWNPDPAPGMIRLWTLEAFAHGAEAALFFRWRQARRGQEQMHAGLLTPDDAPAPAFFEAARALRDIAAASTVLTESTESNLSTASTASNLSTMSTESPVVAEVALLFDYESAWMTAAQRHGDRDFFHVMLDFYGALRRAGANVDVVPPDADLRGRKLVVVPLLFAPPADFVDRVRAAGCVALFGPRCGSKTAHCAVPDNLPPGVLRAALGFKVERVETLPPGMTMKVKRHGGGSFHATGWRELIHPEDAQVAAAFAGDGRPAWLIRDNLRYLACRCDAALMDEAMREAMRAAGVPVASLPADVRMRRRGGLTWFFNYGPKTARLPKELTGEFVTGGAAIPSGGVCATLCAGRGLNPRPERSGREFNSRPAKNSRPAGKKGTTT